MADQKILKVGVVGGTGYTGVELLRLLAQHQHCELKVITSRQEAGTPVAAMFPNLRGHVDLDFSAPSDTALKQCDVVFFATPNGVAMQQARTLFDAGVRIIDIAADFRIKDVATWEKWYATKHACPELIAEAVYGLPEVNREQIKGARIVANPGCYPTAVQLGFLPLLKSASDNFKAYGVSGHRHHPEISQGLNAMAGRAARLVFVPHLTPLIRGIHATLYAQLTGKVDLQDLFEQKFADEPFVDVLPAGSHPETRSVRGSNICRIAVHQPQGGDIAVVLSVIDNLTKGAAGQAVQNMNIMYGLPETTGLEQIALMP